MYGFDIEIAKGFPEGNDHWSTVAPLGVSCAALCDAKGEHGMLWYSAPGTLAMSPTAVHSMVRYLKYIAGKGDAIVTWNGVGFDWRALTYEVPELVNDLKKLARFTYDPMYAIFKQRGFPVSLQNACIGQGLKGKLTEVGGAAAVSMWQDPLLRPKVLEYVIQDSKSTAQVAEKIRDTGQFKWLTGRKTISGERMTLLPAQHYMDMQMPDQSWMDDPLTEAHFTGWL